MNIKIGNITISKNTDPLIIPEIGINHNGNLSIAKAMVDSAYRAGAKIIKNQTHIAREEMVDAAKSIIPSNANKSIYEIIKECSLNEYDESELKKYVEDKGMVYLSTPFSKKAVDRLEKLGVTAYKIGSGEMNNHPLIEYVLQTGKPIIISTGMNDFSSIDQTISIVKTTNTPFALLHTTSVYPTLPYMVRLNVMQEMMRYYENTLIGLSDHTKNNNSSIAAMALGAKIIERHFTDNYYRVGPDIPCSMDENQLRELIQASKEIPYMFCGNKELLEDEKQTSEFAFASVVSIKKISAEEKISFDNVGTKRPGVGQIPAKDVYKILGKKAKKDINEGEIIEFDMFY